MLFNNNTTMQKEISQLSLFAVLSGNLILFCVSMRLSFVKRCRVYEAVHKKKLFYSCFAVVVSRNVPQFPFLMSCMQVKVCTVCIRSDSFIITKIKVSLKHLLAEKCRESEVCLNLLPPLLNSAMGMLINLSLNSGHILMVH